MATKSQQRRRASAEDSVLKELLPARRFRVLLAVELSRNYGRCCLQGVSAYARTHGPWTFLHVEREPEEQLPRDLKELKPDGVIARVQNEQTSRAIEALGVPMVDLLGKVKLPGRHAITADAGLGAAAVFEHFQSLGHTHYAYCGYPGVDFSEHRGGHFRDLVAERTNGTLHEFKLAKVSGDKTDKIDKAGIISRERIGEQEIAQLGAWVMSLPKPIAIFACNDNRGRQLLDACGIVGVKVPEEVSVVGVDNDPVICELANPPMSSLDPDAERIGYDGAAMLDRLMRGIDVSTDTQWVPPRGVVARRSSEMLAVDDPVVAAAVHTIREQACSRLTVDGLADQLHVSRATLERRFARVLKSTPHDEITRVRLERTRQLLLETDYKLHAIAGMTGFCSPAHLSVVFKSSFGVAPGEYRSSSRSKTPFITAKALQSPRL